MRDIDVSVITDEIEKMCMHANRHLPKDMQEGIKACRACEDGPIACTILDQIIDNFQTADKEEVPICQDTGMEYAGHTGILTRKKFRSARIPVWPAYSLK